MVVFNSYCKFNDLFSPTTPANDCWELGYRFFFGLPLFEPSVQTTASVISPNLKWQKDIKITVINIQRDQHKTAKENIKDIFLGVSVSVPDSRVIET